MLHDVIRTAAIGKLLLHDPLEPCERHLSELTVASDVAVQVAERFLNALPGQRALLGPGAAAGCETLTFAKLSLLP